MERLCQWHRGECLLGGPWGQPPPQSSACWPRGLWAGSRTWAERLAPPLLPSVSARLILSISRGLKSRRIRISFVGCGGGPAPGRSEPGRVQRGGEPRTNMPAIALPPQGRQGGGEAGAAGQQGLSGHLAALGGWARERGAGKTLSECWHGRRDAGERVAGAPQAAGALLSPHPVLVGGGSSRGAGQLGGLILTRHGPHGCEALSQRWHLKFPGKLFPKLCPSPASLLLLNARLCRS